MISMRRNVDLRIHATGLSECPAAGSLEQILSMIAGAHGCHGAMTEPAGSETKHHRSPALPDVGQRLLDVGQRLLQGDSLR